MNGQKKSGKRDASAYTIQASQPFQETFIQKLRERIPPGIGIAEEMADLLGVSLDSAYRRIRGQTGLSLDEVCKIARKFSISVDDLFSNGRDTVTFTYTKLTDSSASFEAYMGRLGKHMEMISKAGTKSIFYAAEEIPLFYSFYSPVFADFKLYYWQRAVLDCRELREVNYRKGLMPEHLVNLANSCYDYYFSIPSTEVWTDLTVLTGLRQVAHFFDTGVLQKEMALELLHEYRRTLEMIQKSAEAGRKMNKNGAGGETFTMYSSEVVLGTNCIQVKMGDAIFSYISFNTLNSLTTSNHDFCQETEFWMHNLQRKSTIISGVAEKQRYQFFNGMYRKTDDYIERVKNS